MRDRHEMLGGQLTYSWCFEGLKAVQHWDACFPSGSLVLGILFLPFLTSICFQAFPFFPALRSAHRDYCKQPCRWWPACHQCLLIFSKQSSGPGTPSSKEPPRLPLASSSVHARGLWHSRLSCLTLCFWPGPSVTAEATDLSPEVPA